MNRNQMEEFFEQLIQMKRSDGVSLIGRYFIEGLCFVILVGAMGMDEGKIIGAYIIFWFFLAMADSLFASEFTWVQESSGRISVSSYLKCMPVNWKEVYRIKIRLFGQHYIRIALCSVVTIIIGSYIFQRRLGIDSIFHMMVVLFIIGVRFFIKVMQSRKQNICSCKVCTFL